MSKIMNAIRFTVSVSPSMNQFKHRWSKLNYKKKYLRELKGYELILSLKKKVKKAIVYTRYGSRILDKDNYHGGTKPLTDAIKEKGLIVDDSPKWCEIIFMPQQKCKRGMERTEVVII